VLKKSKLLNGCCCYFAPGRGAKYCNEHVCLSVCLFVTLFYRSHVLASQNFVYMFLQGVAKKYPLKDIWHFLSNGLAFHYEFLHIY